jgi:hypothetical protein
MEVARDRMALNELLAIAAVSDFTRVTLHEE